MKALIVGSTGATGSLLLRQLLNNGVQVKAVARSKERIPADLIANEHLQVIEASILDLSDLEMQELVKGCDTVASCLGHNISFKGIYGKPRRLVTDTISRLCRVIQENRPERPVKFVLMNTTGNRNRDLNENVSMRHRMVVALLRLLVPPHPDNEQAAEYLRVAVGQNSKHVEWVAVRPDGLIDSDQVTEYDLHPSPTRDPIFNAGKTSRINVAHFMAELMTNEELWATWKGRMPVETFAQLA